MLAKVFTDFVVPGLESIGVVDEIGVLGPPLEALDGGKTFAESLCDDVSELLGIGLKLNPRVLNVGSDLAVKLFFNIIVVTTFFSSVYIIFCLFFAFNYFFDLQMGKKIEVLRLRLASGWKHEVFDFLLLNLAFWKLFVVLEGDLGVEKRITTAHGLASVAVIELHRHNGCHVGAVVEEPDALDHLLD